MNTLNENENDKRIEETWRDLAEAIAQRRQKEAEELAKAIDESKRRLRERKKRK